MGLWLNPGREQSEQPMARRTRQRFPRVQHACAWVARPVYHAARRWLSSAPWSSQLTYLPLYYQHHHS